jgi:F0F1-type ATP synthase assembly protein I
VKPPEPRSAFSIGVEWSARVMTLGLELALPAVGGYLVDRWLRTSPWATLAGAIVGFAALMIHLVRINREGTGD